MKFLPIKVKIAILKVRKAASRSVVWLEIVQSISDYPPSHPIGRLARNLLQRKGNIQIRLSPGIWRLTEKIRLQGFNENEPLPQKALKEIGTDGIAGKNGLSRMIKSIKSGKRTKYGWNIHRTRINIQFYEEIYSGEKSSHSWRKANYLNSLPSEAIEYIKENQMQWKDACEDNTLQALSRLIKHKNTIYIGANRTKKFALSIGINDKNHICIPDKNAFDSIDSITDAIKQRLKDQDSDQIAILHSASIVGTNICLSLAQSNIRVQGIDLGLIGTIYDYEYLATRPWFKARGINILRYTEKCNRDKAKRIQDMIKVFGNKWTYSVQNLTSNPQKCIESLESLIANQSVYDFPIASAALLMWKYRYLKKIDEDLLSKNTKEKIHYECWIAASMIYSITRNKEEALSQIKRAEAMCPYDPTAQECRKIIESRKLDDIELWEKALHLENRNTFGSQLTWSTTGDIPSNKF